MALSNPDAQNLLRITLLCKVIQDAALRNYSADKFDVIKKTLLDCFNHLNPPHLLPVSSPPLPCDPPCVACGGECVCPQP
jgi:hypothetical protein